MIFAMVFKEVSFDFAHKYPYEVELVLAEFSDIFLEDLLDELPPMCDIQHDLDSPRSYVTKLISLPKESN